VDLHANELRYVPQWGKWLIWTGANWEPENTLAVFDMARKICRQAASECNKSAEAKKAPGVNFVGFRLARIGTKPVDRFSYRFCDRVLSRGRGQSSFFLTINDYAGFH
jgi:D5 N terminal like